MCLLWHFTLTPLIPFEAVEAIQTPEFLTHEQQADIFYHNAARFLRLSEEDIARRRRSEIL